MRPKTERIAGGAVERGALEAMPSAEGHAGAPGLALGFFLLFAAFSVAVPENSAAAPLDEIVVTATRGPAASFDLPASIGEIDRTAIQQRPGVDLSETLGAVPGVVALNRQNYAQDTQISIRGFGARSTFGVRGLRIYQDGIPATMPDGQGQISQLDLPSAARIEVLRGPFTALYGNSSGGVIALFTEDGVPGLAVTAGAQYGSFDTRHFTGKLSGAQDGVDYVASAQEFKTDGSRGHSAAERRVFNTKIGIDLGAGSKLTLIANATNTPNAQDPLGLTRAQFISDPSQAGTGAEAFNTRKSVDQEQGGIVYDGTLDDRNSVHALVYGGHRATTQYQSIPVATELAPASSGGVIALDRGYYGTDIHWRWALSGFRLVGGTSFDALDEARKGYLNFRGNLLGVQGALRRNEDNRVFDFDQYVQAEFEPSADWLLVGGMRHSAVVVSSHDHYIVPGNGDDSGGVRYGSITPVGGLTWKLRPELRLYMAYGEGFETPTFNELAYRSTSGSVTGLNLGLAPSRSQDFEGGIKAAFGENGRVDLAGFHITTRDELAVEANSNGRAVYQNVGSTVRDGAEIGLSDAWRNGVAALLSFTYLRASYADPFRACPGLPCVPVTIPAGTRLPGVPLTDLYGEMSWRDRASGFSTGIEMMWRSKIFVNDTNSDAAPAALVVNLRAGWKQDFGPWSFSELIRLDNLADRKYAGSVIVNESNGRYFEPAPGRTAFGGVKLEYRL